MIDEGMKQDDIDEVSLQALQLKSRSALLPDSTAVGEEMSNPMTEIFVSGIHS